LYYYRNRYYSPQTGRFISEDSVGWASGQTNAYAYVGGNPISYSDPLGLSRGTLWTGGPSGGFVVHPHKGDIDYYDASGNLSAQYHRSHGDAPHGHNIGPGFDRNEHVPLCPIP
jgi:uncharacterized protein RhaS with RHS repeats